MGYLSNRDGNFTNEEGAWRHISQLFSPGVIGPDAIKVTERGSGSNLSVDVASGESFIDSGLGYNHAGWLADIKNIPLNASNPSNPRITLIVEYVNKSIADSTEGNNNAPDGYDVIAVDGSPDADPSDPSSGTIQAEVGSGNPYRAVARVTVGANVTVITDEDIEDLRTFSSIPSFLISSLPTKAIYLGHATRTSDFSTTSTSTVQITGLSTNIKVPSGGRKVKVTFSGTAIRNSGSGFTTVDLWVGTVGSGTRVASQTENAGADIRSPASVVAILDLAEGNYTINAGMFVSGGTGTLTAGSTNPSYLIAELI